MYRLNDILTALDGLVGWRQSHSLKKQIDSSLTASASGLYFQDAHPLLTLDNMRAVMPDDWIDSYPDWASSESGYSKGGRVRYGDAVYVSLKDANVSWPSDADSWAEYDPLSDWLKEITRAGETKAVQTFITQKTNAQQTRNILENRPLFDGAGRFNDIVPNRGRLVGFEITPLRTIGVTMYLDRIGLQMRSATGDVPLYLFHSGQSEPIARWTLTFDHDSGDFLWLDFDPKSFLAGSSDKAAKMIESGLPYLHSASDGGSYYLVYHQSELPKWMDAINYARDWSREPCMTCNRGDVQLWREFTKYVRVSPFMVNDDDFLTSHRLWDLQDMIYTPSTNYGINFRYTIGCDLSDFIIGQKAVFANVIQLQVAYNALKTIMNNPSVRVNRSQVNASQLSFDLDGDGGGRPTGIAADLSKAYKALEIDTTGISKACLGCRTNGVNYGRM